MAHRRVGVYRRYLEPVPLDAQRQPIPESSWPRKWRFSWVARWFGDSGQRYSRSFDTKAEARAFADERQNQLLRAYRRQGPCVTFLEFYKEHEVLMPGNVADQTLTSHLSTWRMLEGFLGWQRFVHDVGSTDIERFRAARLSTSITPCQRCT